MLSVQIIHRENDVYILNLMLKTRIGIDSCGNSDLDFLLLTIATEIQKQ